MTKQNEKQTKELAEQILKSFGRIKAADVVDCFERGVAAACKRMSVEAGSEVAQKAAEQAWRKVG